eukprot:2550639-Lingulodinium_polyedra.AAC.1
MRFEWPQTPLFHILAQAMLECPAAIVLWITALWPRDLRAASVGPRRWKAGGPRSSPSSCAGGRAREPRRPPWASCSGPVLTSSSDTS